MADQGSTSQYVKLKKIQDAPAEDIQPGELNQPIRVPQLEVHKCDECGQQLPENFQPPADEAWNTNILRCEEDTETCWKGLFCPCVLFGQNVQNIQDDAQWTSACVCHAIFIEGGIALGAALPMFYGFDPKISCMIIESFCFAWWLCALNTGAFRKKLQRKYHLADHPCDPHMVHCCMHWCAICQEHREMKGRLSFNVELPTVNKAPTMQEMSANESPEATGSGSSNTQQT
ncbi:Cell number regulator 6 [Platanthera zijinensis]|uniref:Cell number regulator 6 n=1 Tax=Platanthera zijinensis TaxID=2320716 RepID=A0AAP0AWA9_9ASPA